jgi:hypothetical protein
MGAVVVIIRRVWGEKPLEVALVQGDDVVEQIAPAAAYPAFRQGLWIDVCTAVICRERRAAGTSRPYFWS